MGDRFGALEEVEESKRGEVTLSTILIRRATKRAAPAEAWREAAESAGAETETWKAAGHH